jgi:O-antigen/teichoic acid export membrane protein
LRRFFVQNIFFLILVNLIVKPLWIFGIDRNVQIAVGHELYGQYVALLNFSIIFQVLLDFGLQSYNNRTVAQSPEAMKNLFPNIIIAKGILSLGYVLLVCVLGLLLGYRGHSLLLLFTLCFVQVLNSFLLYLRSNVSAMHRFRTDSILSVSDRLFMIIICSVLLFHPFFSGTFRIEWFIYAQIIAYLFTSIIAFIICTHLTRLDWSHYDLKKVWVICKHSLPYALLIFLMAVYIRSDVFLIERLLPEGKEAGVYAAAYRFLDVSNNVTGVLFAGILLPLFGRMLAQKETVQPLVRLSVNLLLPVAITAMMVAFFFGGQIMYMQLKGMASEYDGKVFALLMAAFPGYCIGYVYATLLTANGNIRSLIGVSLIAVLLNLVLNFILVPLYGAWGGALTCCITQCFLSVANILLAKKVLHLKSDWNWVLRYPAFMLIIFGCCYLMSKSNLSFWVQLFVIAGVASVSMFICGFLPFRKIKELLLNK